MTKAGKVTRELQSYTDQLNKVNKVNVVNMVKMVNMVNKVNKVNVSGCVRLKYIYVSIMYPDLST